MDHQPVLVKEVLEILEPERGGIFVDATVGLGGHAQALLERAGVEKVDLLGIDQDMDALKIAKAKLKGRAVLVQANFAAMAEVFAQTFPGKKADGILLDLGVSSLQLGLASRGFSFSDSGPLDMRMNQTAGPQVPTAAEIVNTWPEKKLAEIFFQYGEERLARKIAKAIVTDRQKQPFADTGQLAELIVRLYPPAARYRHPHPATRVFQALRIVVNQEMQVLERGLAAAAQIMAPSGRLAVISFHSLEDRLVKHYFREKVAEGRYQIITKKPILPKEAEKSLNPRSRSAKLRGLMFLG